MSNIILPQGFIWPTASFASRFNKFSPGRCCCGKPVCMYGICRPGTVPTTIEVSLSHNGQIGEDTVGYNGGTMGDETMLRLAGSTMQLTLAYSNGTGVCVWAARLCDIDADSGLYAVLRLTTGALAGDFFSCHREFCIRIAADDSIDNYLANASYWNSQSLIRTLNTATAITDFHNSRPFQLTDCATNGPLFGSFVADEPEKLDVYLCTRSGGTPGGCYGCHSWNSDIIVSPVSEGSASNVAAICDYASRVLSIDTICRWFDDTPDPAYVMVEFNLTATYPSENHLVDRLNGTHVAEYCSYWQSSYVAYYRCMYDPDGAEFRVGVGRTTCTDEYWATFALHSITSYCGTLYTTGSIGGGGPGVGSGCSATIHCDLLSNYDSWYYGLVNPAHYFTGTATVSF